MSEMNIQQTTPKEDIVRLAEFEINKNMDEWCAAVCSGGEMRAKRGSDIETFVRTTINRIGELLNIDLVARCGNDDKKELIANLPNGTQIIHKHQVDVHIYLNGAFVAVIECKAYLDSCYYVRACDDFRKFKRFGYNVKNYIFTLENSIKEETKLFTDYDTEYICDNVFYLLDGKRSSAKPVYETKHKKPINKDALTGFVDFIFALGTSTALRID
jgi:hypothetical protein